MKRKSPKFRHLFEVIIGLALIFIINLIGASKYARIDLTEDKLHTLSNTTIEFLESVEEVINIEVYLDGELPAYMQKLKNSIQEKIEEFQAYTGNKLKFRFINPNEDEELAEEYKAQLTNSGLYPSYLLSKESGSEEFMEIWPGAKILFSDREQAIQFLPGGNFLVSPGHVANAINQLEYNFIKAFWQLTNRERKTVSFLRGHGELSNAETWSIHYELRQFYNVDTVRIIDSTGTENIHALDRGKSDALIIAKPTKPFTEKEKYVIDQFVMSGGKVFWLVDMIDVNEDSLAMIPMVYTEPVENNVDDMIFKYGARINKNVVSDINSAPILRKNNYKVMNNWFLYPAVTSQTNHELTRNVAPIKIRYGSSVDPVGDNSIKKTVLLETSSSYKVMPARFRVSYDFNDQGYKPIDSLRTDPDLTKPIALLLEGKFASHFTGRITDNFINDPSVNFKDSSNQNQMVVIGDGDIIRNELGMSESGSMMPYGLQFDPIIRDKNNQVVPMYGNGVFFANLMDQLLGNEYLIPLRSRMKVIRLLNREEIASNKSYWKGLNLTIPSILVLIFGLVQFFLRKRRYATK